MTLRCESIDIVVEVGERRGTIMSGNLERKGDTWVVVVERVKPNIYIYIYRGRERERNEGRRRRCGRNYI